MKISLIPTKHILVRATSNSEWDSCDFALITCDDSWEKEIKKNLEAIGTFKAPDNFITFKFYDNSVRFYQLKEDEPEILSMEKGWDFITLEEGEEDSFDRPENRLTQAYHILNKDGSGFYVAYGQHTGEEFYTEELPFRRILENIQSCENLKEKPKMDEIPETA